MRLLITVISLSAVSSSMAQVAFWELPFDGTSGRAWGTNFNGDVVVGETSPTGIRRACRWVNRVLELLPAPTQALASDATGDVVVGPGYRWTPQTGAQSLGSVPGCQAGGLVDGKAVSQDGLVVAGTLACSTPTRLEPFRWTQATGITPLGFTASGEGISGDGRVIVGQGSQAYKWSQETGFVVLPGSTGALAASFNGSVIVGFGPIRWVIDSPQFLQPLGNYASEVSQDGLVIAGVTTGGEPFVWDPVHRMRNLRAILLAHGISTADWSSLSLTGLAGDGTVVVGYGSRAGVTRPWMARIPRFCYANCDDSTMSPTLNVNDFVCFLTHFADADLFYADCNLDAALNVNDFVCFTQKFAAGCP